MASVGKTGASGANPTTDASTSTDTMGSGPPVIDPYVVPEPWWWGIPMLPPPVENVWNVTRAVIPNPTCVNPTDPPFFFRTYHFTCQYCNVSWTSELLKAETGLFCKECCHFIRPYSQSDQPPPFIGDIPSYGEFWSTNETFDQPPTPAGLMEMNAEWEMLTTLQQAPPCLPGCLPPCLENGGMGSGFPPEWSTFSPNFGIPENVGDGTEWAGPSEGYPTFESPPHGGGDVEEGGEWKTEPEEQASCGKVESGESKDEGSEADTIKENVTIDEDEADEAQPEEEDATDDSTPDEDREGNHFDASDEDAPNPAGGHDDQYNVKC